MINKNSDLSFLNLGLNKDLISVLDKNGFKKPFPIQTMCIKSILNNYDILGISDTGSGKTAAFILPILNKLNKYTNKTKALIVEPTRELAIQVNDVIKTFSNDIKWIKHFCVYGGVNLYNQIINFKRINHIIVGTPGRLIDHIKKKTLNLNDVSILVIDEADQMLKMGFIDDIKKINSILINKKQTLLFTATMPNNLKKISYSFMNKDFKEIICKKKISYINKIYQYYFILNKSDNRNEILIKFLFKNNFKSIIIFTNTKNESFKLNEFLSKYNYKTKCLNSDINQRKREEIIKKFKNNYIKILISTDVLSRGIDINNIDWIINFNFPDNINLYIHRIGRTGRAGKSGKSLSILNNNEYNRIPINIKNNFININKILNLNNISINYIKIYRIIKDIKRILSLKIDINEYSKYIDIIVNDFKIDNKKLNLFLLYLIINKNYL